MNDELIADIKESTRALRVEVTLRIEEDKYYIDFDGSKSYKTTHQWNDYWRGFDCYVRFICETKAIEFKSMKFDEYTAFVSVYLGTLFDLLSRPTKCQD